MLSNKGSSFARKHPNQTCFEYSNYTYSVVVWSSRAQLFSFASDLLWKVLCFHIFWIWQDACAAALCCSMLLDCSLVLLDVAWLSLCFNISRTGHSLKASEMRPHMCTTKVSKVGDIWLTPAFLHSSSICAQRSVEASLVPWKLPHDVDPPAVLTVRLVLNGLGLKNSCSKKLRGLSILSCELGEPVLNLFQ